MFALSKSHGSILKIINKEYNEKNINEFISRNAILQSRNKDEVLQE